MFITDRSEQHVALVQVSLKLIFDYLQIKWQITVRTVICHQLL